MPKRPTFESKNCRFEQLRRGIEKRWHVIASDGDFIAGFDGKYEALAAANARNALSKHCHAEITFEVKDTKEATAEQFRGASMPLGNTKSKSGATEHSSAG